MAKEDRKNAINKFKLGKAKILITTDLSARGLDIVDVSHVFNLDFPKVKTNICIDVVELLEEIEMVTQSQ